ncbi:hypothetical protein CP500_011030 [Tychonema bourrellyi FEM_GT703]|uniref:Uncharacterized protein n=1 Tax=Tychonema bourrellyi FEM_GT703 TaxID=2040638 RepID=A0A2G4F0W5_9CYAN|nr:hypothetical protein [Tychonema bourrellyi]PHX55399.1 hypothetical protein CP500_011030 [Tychonema bourrellyi FEM_GT703]
MKDDRPENRDSAKDKVENVVKELKLTKNERQQLHYRLEDYMSYQDILELAKSMFQQNSEGRW